MILPRSLSLRQHWSLRSIDSRNHNEVSTKLGHNTWNNNYRYTCCRHGCSVPKPLKSTLRRSMSLRQHWGALFNTKLGNNTWTYNYRYACCRLGCSVHIALKFTIPRSMPRRQHLGLRSIDSRNHNEVSTKLGHNNCIYNYRYACCRHGCSVPNALKLTLPKQGPCHCANTGTCELSTPATSMRSAPSSVALLGLKLSLRMMSTWLLSPQRLKVDTPEARSMPLRQHWDLRYIDSFNLHEVNTKLDRTFGL